MEGEVGLRIMALLVEEGDTLGEEVVRIQTKQEEVGARIVVVRVVLALPDGIRKMMDLFKLSSYRTKPKYYAIRPV